MSAHTHRPPPTPENYGRFCQTCMQDLIPICGITNIRRYATDGDFTYSETGSLQTQFRERDSSRGPQPSVISGSLMARAQTRARTALTPAESLRGFDVQRYALRFRLTPDGGPDQKYHDGGNRDCDHAEIGEQRADRQRAGLD